MKYIASLLALFMSLAVPVPALGALCLDADGDRYYVNDASCQMPNLGTKGEEKALCDCPTIKIDEECVSVGGPIDEETITTLFTPGKISSLKGANIHPGAIEKAENGIDENCDGVDGEYIPGGEKKDIAEYIDLVVTFLGYIIAGVSTAVLIWGGIMYAGAAGEEEKTRKARKAMIGAIVGLIIGILASTIIGTVIGYITT